MRLVMHCGSHVWGGNEKWLTNLAAGMSARGHEVTVSVPRGPVRERLQARGVRTSGVRPRGDLDLASASAFALWLRRERPDTLLLTSWRRLPWGVWAARRAGVPRVVLRLGIVREHPAAGRYARALRGVDALIVNSAEVEQGWLASAPAGSSTRVHRVLNAVLPPAPPRNELVAALRAELGEEAAGVLYAGAGNLAPRKGFDLLLRAFAALGDDAARLVVIGGGSHGEALRAEAAALGVAGRVHWLGHREQAAEAIGGCDVFVLTSRNEGMANVMLEAMAAGVPVVAAEVSGAREALAAEGGSSAGWLVPPGDAQALAETLGEVAGLLRDHPAAVEARTAEALRRVRTRFGMERMLDECEAILFPQAAGRGAA